MKKRNLRPQQVAPVARETNTTSNTTSNQQGQVTPSWSGLSIIDPFAGDGAE